MPVKREINLLPQEYAMTSGKLGQRISEEFTCNTTCEKQSSDQRFDLKIGLCRRSFAAKRWCRSELIPLSHGQRI